MSCFDVLSLLLLCLHWADDTWSLFSVSVLLFHYWISNVALGFDTLGTGQTLKILSCLQIPVQVIKGIYQPALSCACACRDAQGKFISSSYETRSSLFLSKYRVAQPYFHGDFFFPPTNCISNSYRAKQFIQWMNEYIRASGQRAKRWATGREDHEQPGGRREDKIWAEIRSSSYGWASSRVVELSGSRGGASSWAKMCHCMEAERRAWCGATAREDVRAVIWDKCRKGLKAERRCFWEMQVANGVGTLGAAQAAEQHPLISDMERHK